MKFKLTGRRFVDAVLGLFLVSALAHGAVLIITAVGQRNLGLLNYFKVLELQTFWPGLDRGGENWIVSWLAAGAVVGFIYWRIGSK